MSHPLSKPRILIVTPEISYLPPGMGDQFSYLNAKDGGVGDVSATLIRTLFEQGADVHVAVPNYRRIFNKKLSPIARRELDTIQNKINVERINLAKDRSLFYVDQIAYPYGY